jgi:hypothetical protein
LKNDHDHLFQILSQSPFMIIFPSHLSYIPSVIESELLSNIVS